MTPVCAIVINWRGWRDTVTCLESLFALEDAPLHVVVCDNGSGDESVPRLREWLSAQPGLDAAVGDPQSWCAREGAGMLHGVSLLPLEHNLGYAGGINAAMAWARRRPGAPPLFWLLNNDVEVLPGALRALLDAHAQVPGAGLCGSVLLDWDAPQQVQAVGGIYSRWLGVGAHSIDVPAPPASVRLDIDYPVGASLLVSEQYVQRVGPMEDSYFLYYEEIDWVERGRRLGYRPVVALGSRLRHKEGGSTGSRGGVRHKSLLSEHHGIVNRLRITRRFWPAYLPAVWASLWLVVADRVVHREFRRAALVFRLMFSPGLWLR